MKLFQILIIAVFLLFFISIGCTSQTSPGQEAPGTDGSKVQTEAVASGETKEDEDMSATGAKKVSKTDEDKISTTSGEDDRYYYNIKIISPSDLDTLSKEITSDEYLIHNEKGELIGIVSPRKLYIRGDLVDLQRDTGTSDRVFDKTDVAEHLVDITFGNDNAKVSLFKSNKDYQFWMDAFYTGDDTQFLLELAPMLNSLSDTTQFEDEELALGFLMTNYADVPYNFYNIKIVPEKMLEDFKDDRTSGERLIKDPEGNFIGIVADDHLYLLDSLSPEDRKYYMLYGILYSMGMHGTSYTEKDSFFYQVGGVQNRELSNLDKEAIKLLYGGRVKSGSDMEEMKKTLGLDT